MKPSVLPYEPFSQVEAEFVRRADDSISPFWRYPVDFRFDRVAERERFMGRIRIQFRDAGISHRDEMFKMFKKRASQLYRMLDVIDPALCTFLEGGGAPESRSIKNGPAYVSAPDGMLDSVADE